MARLIGPDEACRLVFIISGANAGKALAQGLTATIYTDAALTTLADITDLSDVSITGSVIAVDDYSRLPLFKFPDGVDTLYTSVNLGPVVPLYARTDDRLDALSSTMFDVRNYGTVDVTGAADSQVAVLAAIAACYTAGGGVIYIPAGIVRCDAQLSMPNDGHSPIFRTVPIAFVGAGSRWDGQWETNGLNPGCSVLDLRYNGTVAKIVSLGSGLLAFRDLTITDLGTSSLPFLQSTNTTLLIERTSWYGNPSKIRTTCDQDGIVMGSTGVTIGNTVTSEFQGYGTVIRDNYFARLRRAVYMRSDTNGLVVRDNTFSNSCGAADGTAGAIDIGPTTGRTSAGGMIASNLFECSGYVYPIRCNDAVNFIFEANNFYDPNVNMLAYIRFDAACRRNLIIDGYRDDTKTLLSEDATSLGSNTVITSHQGQLSTFTEPVAFTSTATAGGLRANGTAVFTGGANAFTIQPAADQTEGTILLRVLRSAADDVSPGSEIFSAWQGGTLQLTNSAGAVVQFSNGGKTWNAVGSGGAFLINSGTGGSYITLQGFGVKLLTHDSANTVTILTRSGSPETSSTQPVGSLVARTDGTAALGVLYVKETGAGNTGWLPALTRSGIYIKEGANLRQGVATLVGGTVTVSCTAVTASSRIFLTTQSLGTVAVPKEVAVTARVVSTSFTITSADATDTSVVAYQICEPG